MSPFTSSSKKHHKLKSKSSATSNRKSNRYDVYLSFCEQDTGSYATGLYTALTNSGARLVVFWDDDDKLGSRGRELPASSLNVIQDCKVAIILFSNNYAKSKSCIQEFEKITECCRTTADFKVLPVLYDHLKVFHDFVDRICIKETSSEKEDKFMSWLAAINIYSGLIHFADRIGSRDIKDVVFSVNIAINDKRDPSYGLCRVSISSRMQDVIQLLKQSKCPLLLGIWGVTGIKSIFEWLSFL